MSLRLVTERLVVRDCRAADAAAIADIWDDPEVTRHLGGPRERAKVEESVRAAAADPPELDLWTVERDGAVIGNCGLLAKEVEGRDELELVYVIAAAEQGRGYATEAGRAVRDHAAQALGRERLIALVHEDNAPSVRVAEKLDFRHERAVERPGGRVLQLHAWQA